ncbi:MAG: hypothetical protein IKI93_02125 [Clostridia bacterium]|nr:hypothetical protein [Clostridia bacterium]
MEQRDFLEKDTIRTPEKELEVRVLMEQYHAAMTENAALKEQLAQLKKVVYGQKSEKSEVVLEGAEQIPMFDEAEQESDVNPKTLQTTEVKAHKRIKHTRDELNPDLPVEEVFHEVEDKTCDKCSSEMIVIGKEKIRDELVYVPACK